MKLRPVLKKTTLAVLCIFFSFDLACGQDQLDDATVVTEFLNANDIAYDIRRDLLYASIKNTSGDPNGNLIVTLDPDTLEVLDRKTVGDAPNQLAITNDSSRLYIGVDGEASMRYLDLNTGTLGPLQPLFAEFFFPEPATANEIVVVPTDPTTVMVSTNQIGNSHEGDLEIFNDSGKVGGRNGSQGPISSFAVVGLDTLITFEFIDFCQYDFDGSAIQIKDCKSANNAPSEIIIEASGGLIYASDGQVINPDSLTQLGSFTNASGGHEVSGIDHLAYFLNGKTLKVYDTQSFLLLDEFDLPLDRIEEVTSLSYAGNNRLTYLNQAGDIGVISGIQFSPPPQSRIVIQGTENDDWVTFDPVAKEIFVNGAMTPIPFETTSVHFNGGGGIDRVLSIGDPDQEELAVLQGTEMTVKADNYFFAARDVVELEFESTSRSDTCVLFDSDAEEQLISTPHSVKLQFGDSLLQATKVGDVFVFSSGASDSAIMRGGIGPERVNGNLERRLIRMTGEDFYVSLSGFENVNANGGIGVDDLATLIDSNESEIAYFGGNYGRILNDTTDYNFRGFELMNFSFASGNDIGIFQQTLDSNVAGNGIWETLSGPNYRNNTFGLDFLDVREP